MYDRVVEVPRLLRFYGRARTCPTSRWPRRGGTRPALLAELGEPLCTAGLCLYGTAGTASPGTATGSAGAREDTVVAILSLGTPRACCSGPGAAARRRATSSATAICW